MTFGVHHRYSVYGLRKLNLFTVGMAALFACCLLCGEQRSEAQNAPYVVLSKHAILIQDSCEANQHATVTPVGVSQAAFTASVIGLREDPAVPVMWTLVKLDNADLQSDQKYYLTFDGLKVAGKTTCADKGPWTIDTTPQVTYQSKNNGTGVLVSNVAFSFLKHSVPIQLVDAQICQAAIPSMPCGEVTVSYDLGNISLPVRKNLYREVNVDDIITKGIIAIPGSIGTIPVDSKDMRPLVSELRFSLGQGGTLLGLSNVLADNSSAQGLKLKAAAFTATKAPATKDAAWLWISGTLTAGTGAAPAWVLDGKIDVPPVFEKGAFQLRVATATANIGNNKIDGQAAKDVIDFSSPSARWNFEAAQTGFSLNVAPTYETNRALTHRNMLVVEDFAIAPNLLDRSQSVRIAKRFFRFRDSTASSAGSQTAKSSCPRTAPITKMPDQGDFSDCRFPRSGWRLNLHPGFESGAAIEPVVFTNSTTKAVVGTIPTYTISRAVLGVDGVYQYRNFSIEDYVTGRYLFTTEWTAVNDKRGNPYLETVIAAKAVNVLSVTYSPGAEQHIKVTLAYTNGFSSPVYQRANGIRFGLGVAY
jgi:hypothetical protein